MQRLGMRIPSRSPSSPRTNYPHSILHGTCPQLLHSQDHTVEDMLDLLEPAFQIGLPKPSDSQKLKKCLERVSAHVYFSFNLA